ncbi:NAD(P)-binding protein [Plenodomus tracheiphilus IPT5]|uniref:NAD(P)-binding protein n=1 Tax=Plenodomus tracheiphilus IPT5 TaxID=1408161 RepID=A0A6A7AV29_9PLEO|nr:NAD(P)-binding protein [Plenodomus tracheiphilus IPT5]
MALNSVRPSNVLVFGATGVIGEYIIQELYTARSTFSKLGIFTSPGTAESKADKIHRWKERGVEVIVGDVGSERDVAKAYEGYDTVVSALGRNAVLAQIPLIKVAEASPTVHTFYPSEYGTDIEYNASSANEKPHQLKLRVRKYIRENIQKLHITYLVTGPYSDLFFSPASRHTHAGNFDPKNRKVTLLGTGEERISFTTMKDVGRLLVAALKTPAQSHERILKVNSFTTTGKEALAEFESQTAAAWNVEVTTLDELKKYEEEAWARGDPLATVFTLRRIWTEGGTLYDERDNGSIGFEGSEETLEEQVGKLIKKHG